MRPTQFYLLSKIIITHFYLAATQFKHVEAVAVLLCAGADENIENRSGVTALHEAADGPCMEVFVLKKKGFEAVKVVYPRVGELKHPVSLLYNFFQERC